MSIFELNNMQQKLFASEIINKKISISDIFLKKKRRKNQLKHALVIVLVKVLN